MPLARRSALLFLILFGALVPLLAKPKTLSVTGRLTRTMAIGAETSGWSIELISPILLDGKEIHAIEVRYSDSKKLESLQDHWVKAKGTFSTATGVETGHRPVLQLSSIQQTAEPKLSFQLDGEFLLSL
ncbi:MAG TPA: hypothetical protein VMH31_09510 [Methylomirabilota bacterium]|nr:hypothetical protein [Methylomirabilota bacterium]